MVAIPCGFKSHLPQEILKALSFQGFFLCDRKFLSHKTLRADRTAAEWKNVACATRRRRRILLRRILFYFIEICLEE
ncbi:MAG: hypothetical protein EGP94_03985 [Lachnospiraceae bacterium]|nr:hypothetical protein [Lachnospiraceae bacterium]